MGGWWWGKDPQTPVTKASDEIPDPVPTPSEPPASTRELTDGNVPRHSADADIERELQSLLSATRASGEETKRRFENVSQQARKSLGLPPKPSSFDGEDTAEPSPQALEDIAPTIPDDRQSIYPETMSCRDAFDRAFYCNSLGGQFTNVYRYGGTRDCKPNWNEFWFCMKLKSQDEDSRRRKIRAWYIEKEAKVKMGPNSEDIWDLRESPLERAFHKDPDKFRGQEED